MVQNEKHEKMNWKQGRRTIRIRRLGTRNHERKMKQSTQFLVDSTPVAGVFDGIHRIE